MAIINTVPEDEATGPLAALYADDIAFQGFVGGHTKVLGLNPAALEAFDDLIRAVAKPLGIRRYELVTLAAAYGAKSRHCRLAHGRRSLTYIDEADLVALARDYHHAGLSAAEVAMMEFAEQLSRDATAMTDADSQRLRDLGFSDEDIVNIALAAGARNFFSRAINALAVEVDPTDLGDELREALISGI